MRTAGADLLVLVLTAVALLLVHGEMRVLRSPNSLDENDSNKNLAKAHCDVPIDGVVGFPKFSDRLRKDFCSDQEATKKLKVSEQLPSEDYASRPSDESLALTDIILISILSIIMTFCIALIVYKLSEGYWNSTCTRREKVLKKTEASASLPPEIELEEFTDYFVPRLNIFCNLSKKPGRYTKIPKHFERKCMVYDIEDQQYYFDIHVNLHNSKFRNTKKKECLPMEGFMFNQIMNIIQELAYGSEQSQNNLLEALANPDADASLIFINDAITNPAPVPPPSSESSDDDEILLRALVNKKNPVAKKKKGHVKLTVVNESLARGMVDPSSGTFSTHEPPEKNDSLGYGTASTCASSGATPKEGTSTEGSLENVTGKDKILPHPLMLKPGTSKDDVTNKRNRVPGNKIPTLREIARKYLPDGDQRRTSEGNLNTTISSLEVEASSTCSKVTHEQSFDDGPFDISKDSLISAASEKSSSVEDLLKPLL